MTTSHGVEFLGPVELGRTIPVFRETLAVAETRSKTVLLSADSCLVSLWVGSITSGSITVTVTTITEVGKEFEVISFPPVTGPTANLLLKKASLAMSRVRINVAATGPCAFEVDLKGISAGEASTKQVGSANATAVKYTATGTPSILIPSSLVDRTAVQIQNNGPTGILYLGFSLAEATLANGFPVPVGGQWVGDLASGQVIYSVTSGPSIDVRTVQAYG
jgi:hypothetical protein